VSWQDRNESEPTPTQRQALATRRGEGCMPVLVAALVLLLAFLIAAHVVGCSSAREPGAGAHYPIPRLLDPVTEEAPDLAEPLP
jgi:hypothetical protein